MTTPVLDDLSTVDPAPTGRLDVAALRMLRAIDDAGTITGAATLLGLSQPAVSQHVRRLERRLGTALLDRSGRSVRLTEAGAVLARHGSTVTAALRAAEAEVASLTGLRAGRVRLVGFPSAAASLVPRALAALRQEHPGLTVALDEAEPPQSLQLLRSGRCDLALTFEYPGVDRDPAQDDRAGLVSTRLLDDPTYVALPAAHPAAATPSLDLADLADERWIAGCPRCRGHLFADAAGRGFVPTVEHATDHYMAVLALVGSGLGVALLPGLVRPTADRDPGVVLRSARGLTGRTVHAVTTPDLLRVPAVAATLAALVAATS
ncbi:LysR substrate-binding domain-containing protein [Cellulomonas soli]|uniref:LysR family transcriptional regulator n=1 Tax=Cellulomonas soli TaxID=931535 RepID=A0A512PHV2_9CELL|nr:LysR substrate-binding domain-containing protein [Cellulomonas soli]NYI59273.1 DNA-binding transcriptional LysR family regulator [Cellulomonas soli]GEP70777.1 LysR family transcriptional regulator [Cellulomonas soli]